MTAPAFQSTAADARRQRARRTALTFALIAVGVYVGFLLIGALGQ